MMERPGVDSEEKHEPVRNIDIVVVDSLKALDPKRPIREADVIRARPKIPNCLIGQLVSLEANLEGPRRTRGLSTGSGARTTSWTSDEFAEQRLTAVVKGGISFFDMTEQNQRSQELVPATSSFPQQTDVIRRLHVH